MAMAASGKRQSFYADLDRLRQHFDSLDAEKSGHIGLQELTKLIESIPGVEESAVPELMDRLDRDKDGKVQIKLAVNISCTKVGVAGRRTYAHSDEVCRYIFCALDSMSFHR